jgi:RNA-splicing ligase RtcB
MNHQLHQRIETIEEIQSEFTDRSIAPGTVGAIVECYQNPECYAVDLAIPDASLAGGFAYENVVLFPVQFQVVSAVNDAVMVAEPRF